MRHNSRNCRSVSAGFGGISVSDIKRHIVDVPDFPKPGILFRDITPLLRTHFAATLEVMDGLFSEREWQQIDGLAGIESRGFILAGGQGGPSKHGIILS